MTISVYIIKTLRTGKKSLQAYSIRAMSSHIQNIKLSLKKCIIKFSCNTDKRK